MVITWNSSPCQLPCFFLAGQDASELHLARPLPEGIEGKLLAFGLGKFENSWCQQLFRGLKHCIFEARPQNSKAAHSTVPPFDHEDWLWFYSFTQNHAVQVKGRFHKPVTSHTCAYHLLYSRKVSIGGHTIQANKLGKGMLDLLRPHPMWMWFGVWGISVKSLKKMTTKLQSTSEVPLNP